MKRSILLMVLVVATTGVAVGDSITFNASGTYLENPLDPASLRNLAASATFEIVGSQLIITLTNTGPTAEYQRDLLSGVYFDLENLNELTRVTATFYDGQVLDGGDPTTLIHNTPLDVGTEWAAVVNQAGDVPPLLDGTYFRGAQYGISANGLDYFGEHNRFDDNSDGNLLDWPASPDGANYGMAAAVSAAGIGGLNGVPIAVGGYVEFVFDFAGALSVDDISNVNFQYGTSATDPNITIVPEPSTMSLLGIGIAGFMAMAKMRRKHA